jgi:restriction endonuclease S subunit
MQLSEIADIVRCQLGRSRKPAKGLACREIVLSGVNPVNGFVGGQVGETVWMDLDPATKQSKYLIRAGDILISFRGTGATLGRVGLVLDETDEPGVAGMSLAVVRPRVNGIWLYYWLSQARIREYFLSMASGSQLIALNLSTVRALILPTPTAEEIEKVHARHAEIVRLDAEMRTARAALDETLAGMVGLD